jgi:hypothetical protein
MSWYEKLWMMIKSLDGKFKDIVKREVNLGKGGRILPFNFVIFSSVVIS